ncbi:MAG: InlB B-repeat-containing protein [Clostridia bacterium]|nr:InlB B-repeat-containing protein [Clostridia bacterium]
MSNIMFRNAGVTKGVNRALSILLTLALLFTTVSVAIVLSPKAEAAIAPAQQRYQWALTVTVSDEIDVYDNSVELRVIFQKNNAAGETFSRTITTSKDFFENTGTTRFSSAMFNNDSDFTEGAFPVNVFYKAQLKPFSWWRTYDATMTLTVTDIENPNATPFSVSQSIKIDGNGDGSWWDNLVGRLQEGQYFIDDDGQLTDFERSYIAGYPYVRSAKFEGAKDIYIPRSRADVTARYHVDPFDNYGIEWTANDVNWSYETNVEESSPLVRFNPVATSKAQKARDTDVIFKDNDKDYDVTLQTRYAQVTALTPANSTKCNYNVTVRVPHTLYVDTNGGTYGGEIGNSILVTNNLYSKYGNVSGNIYNNKYTLSTPTKYGYAFKGWQIVYGPGSVNGNVFTAGNGNTVLQAQWEATEYTVYYKLTANSDPIARTDTHTFGDKFDLPTLAELGMDRLGYTFNGWTTNKGTETFIDGQKDVQNLSGEDLEVYLIANWTPITYHIDYEWNGGSTKRTVIYDFTVEGSLNLRDPKRTEYAFVGWYINELETEADAAKKKLISGPDLIGNPNLKDGKSLDQILREAHPADPYTIHVTAVWIPADFKITYVLENDQIDNEMNPEAFSKEQVADGNSFTLDNPKWIGHTFLGWSEDGLTNEDGTPVNAKKPFTIDTKKDYLLYAHFEWAKYTLIMDGNGADNGDTPPVTKTYGQNAQLKTNGYSRTGYTFKGWATTPEWPTTVEGAKFFRDGATIDDDSLYSEDAPEDAKDVTLYAIWEPINYTITFITNRGESIPQLTYNEGTDDYLPLPTAPGYNFVGWEVRHAEGTWTSKGNIIEKDYKLDHDYGNLVLRELEWEPITYTLRLNSNNGKNGIALQEVVYDTRFVIDDPYFVMDGSTLIGWARDPEATAPEYYVGEYIYDGLGTVEGEIVDLYAVWEHDQLTVTFINEYDGTTTRVNVGYSEAVEVPEAPAYISRDDESHYAFVQWDSGTADLNDVRENITVTAVYRSEDHQYYTDANRGYLASSCTQEGYTTLVCENCDHTMRQTLPRSGHEIDENGWTYNPDTHTHTGHCIREDADVTERCRFDDGVIEDDATYFGGKKIVYTCEVCGGKYETNVPADPHVHHGNEGTATCVDRAICVVCGLPYGDYDNTNHGNFIVVDEVEATCTEDGHSAYTYCDRCHDYIVEPVTYKATGHKDANNDGICDICRTYIPLDNRDNSQENVRKSGGFECSMCKGTDGKFTGIKAIRHFFVHITEWFKSLFRF